MSIKLAKTSKMPCKSWSLQALDTCPGSIDPLTGDLVPACVGCYATDGFYRMTPAINARAFNRADWKRAEWVAGMVAAIGGAPYFRWFDSGDMYSVKLARKILEVMRLTPGCRHWLPTRMYKFAKFEQTIAAMNALPNVVVRFSSDDIHGETVPGRFTSTIFDPERPAQSTGFICEAYTRGGKCGDCRACWDRDVPQVDYPQHGRKMAALNLKIMGA